MKSLDWPYPSVLAGSLRTLLGKTECHDTAFSKELVEKLKSIRIAGPLPLINGQLYFPAPKDLVVYKNDRGIRAGMILRPAKLPDGADCDLPYGLRPVEVFVDAKPEKSPAFWSCSTMSHWLREEYLEIPPEQAIPELGFFDGPAKDERMHVSIDPNSGAAQEGMLFKTVGLNLPPGVKLAAQVEASDEWMTRLTGLDTYHPFGGERRLVNWKQAPSQAWKCPEEIRGALVDASPDGKGLRLVLATPAVFQLGWRPNWLNPINGRLEGRVPGTTVSVRLVSACIDRWRPISGWSLEKNATLRPGPKALRRLVPAGSTYFFEMLSGDGTELADKLWLYPASDAEQDRCDGFGLALWGIWKGNEPRKLL